MSYTKQQLAKLTEKQDQHLRAFAEVLRAAKAAGNERAIAESKSHIRGYLACLMDYGIIQTPPEYRALYIYYAQMLTESAEA